MDTKRSVAITSVAINKELRMPFIVENFHWALTKSFETWTQQRKRYTLCLRQSTSTRNGSAKSIHDNPSPMTATK